MKDNKIYSFGLNSKSIKFILNHPILTAIVMIGLIGFLHYYENSGGNYLSVVPTTFFGFATIGSTPRGRC